MVTMVTSTSGGSHHEIINKKLKSEKKNLADMLGTKQDKMGVYFLVN